MEAVTETYRAKVSIKNLNMRLHKSTRSVAINPSCYRVNKDSKGNMKSKAKRQKSKDRDAKRQKSTSKVECSSKCSNKDRKRKGKKLKEPITLATLKCNVEENCCAICGIFVEYVKEAVRLVCLRECSREPRIMEILGDLYEALGCLCTDCLNFIKYIMRVLIVYK